MAVKLNRTAYAYAQELVREGKVVADDRDAWSEHQPSTAEENEFIRQHGFAEYAKAKQLKLDLRTWGGQRKRAGRKPKGARAGVPHASRPSLAARHPVHATLRVLPHVWNLRSRRCFSAIATAFAVGRERDGFRLIHFSVQGNHLHLVVEARDAESLSRGMQGLTIWMAKRLNRVMGRRGAVFADRYHEHVLRSPSEVARALAYVLGNFAVHARRRATGRRARRSIRTARCPSRCGSAPDRRSSPSRTRGYCAMSGGGRGDQTAC